MSDLLDRDVKNMLVQIRWKYKGDKFENGCSKIFTFVTLDCINRKVQDLIQADSCYKDIEYAYWFNASGIKTYIKRQI